MECIWIPYGFYVVHKFNPYGFRMDSIEYAYGMHMSIWIPYSMQMVSISIAHGSHIPHADFFLVPFGSHTGYGFRMDSVWNPYGSHIERELNPYGFYFDSI